MRSIISVILSAALVLSVLTGCAGRTSRTEEARTTPKPAAATATPEATTMPAEDAGNALGDAAKDAGDTVGGAVEGAGDVAGQAVEDAGDAVGDLLDGEDTDDGRVTDGDGHIEATPKAAP